MPPPSSLQCSRVPSCLSCTNGPPLPSHVFIRCEIGENSLGGNGPAGNRAGLVMFVVLHSPGDDTDKEGASATPPEQRSDNKFRNKHSWGWFGTSFQFPERICAPEAF